MKKLRGDKEIDEDEEMVKKPFVKEEKQINFHLCCVCMKEPRNVVLKYCNHLCVCDNCKDKLIATGKSCPICGLVITSAERIFVC